MRRATIKEVAEAAGVGVATVSRVLSGGSASAATRERVLATAAQLDYRPSALGRNLRRRGTGGLGLLLPDLTDPFHGALAEGVLAYARSVGAPVLTGSTGGDPEQEAELVGALLEQSVDRLVAVPAGSAESWTPAARAGLWTVFADRLPPGQESDPESQEDLELLDGLRPPLTAPAAPAVLADDRTGLRTAVRYLTGLGHRRLAYLGGAGDTRRVTAFAEALGPLFDEELVVLATTSRDAAYAAAAGLLQSRAGLTAVVAGGGPLGEATLLAARALGLRLPRDLSLVMYGDAPWAGLAAPPLTVIARPARELGHRAAELALRAERRARSVLLPTELIVRGSCAPPAAGPGRRRPGLGG